MIESLQGLINGIALGGLYSLFALSIVVLYRTTRLVNFAQGNLAMFLAFIAYFIITDLHIPVAVVLPIGLGLGAVAGAIVYVVLLRPFPSVDELNPLFRTLGLMMLLFALAKRLWGAYEPYRFPSLFGEGGFTIAGYRVLWLRVGILGIALGLAGAFALFLRLPRIGLMFRVVASDRTAARLIGIPVHRVEAVAWAVSGSFGLAVGMLFAPLFSLSSDMMSGFLLTGFTAALLGGLTSFRGALVAGILVGIMDSELSLYTSTEWRAVATFALMLGVLLLRPAGLFGSQAVVRV